MRLEAALIGAILAVAIVYLGSVALDFNDMMAVAMTVAVASAVFGFASGIELAPVAGLLIMVPPVMKSIPEDPWIGLLTLFFGGLLVAVAVMAAFGGAAIGGLFRLGRGDSRLDLGG